MTFLEKQVWASVFAKNFIEKKRWIELLDATVAAIEEADNAIIALRCKIETHDFLHIDEGLELERKGEE